MVPDEVLLSIPPARDFCERMQWVDHPRGCPNEACGNWLRSGKLCARTLVDLFDYAEMNPGFVVQPHREIIGWALEKDQSRVYQLEKQALVKLRKRVDMEAA